MPRVIKNEEIRDIIKGATFLGAGGGGSLRDGLRLLEELASAGKDEFKIVDPEEMDETRWAVMVAGIGAPKALEEGNFGPEALVAFSTMQKISFLSGKNIGYLMAGELGGFNTMVPLYTAALMDVPVIDADGNGRAVPELATGLYPIYNIPPVPLVMAGNNGDAMIIILNDPSDHHAAENIARHVSMAYGMSAAFCTWIVDRKMIEEYLVPKSITTCKNVGNVLRDADNSAELTKRLQALLDARELFIGEISSIEMKTEGGFDFGITNINGVDAYSGKSLSISVKNENILARDGSDNVIATVPDLICLVNLESMTPLTNAETKKGQVVGIYGVSAPAKWLETPLGFGCWKHILEKLEYHGDYVSVK